MSNVTLLGRFLLEQSVKDQRLTLDEIVALNLHSAANIQMI